MTVLDDMMQALHEIELQALRPLLKSVTMHPDDFAALRAIAREKATERLYSDEVFGPMRVDGIPIYQHELVPKGRPWYDPPEAGPVFSPSGGEKP